MCATVPSRAPVEISPNGLRGAKPKRKQNENYINYPEFHCLKI